MKSKKSVVAWRALSAAFLVLCLLVTSFASVHSAQAQSAQESGTQVRIWVRKLESGNVEFGLTEVGLPGGPRVREPHSRYLLYATATVGTWYYSGREDVGPGLAKVRVRIRARKLASGNVEFGLRVANSEVWVPQARYLVYASTSASDDLLYSSVFHTGPSRGCANGIAVPNPLNHPEFVEDCNVYLSALDSLLAGHRYRPGDVLNGGTANAHYILSDNSRFHTVIEHPAHEWTSLSQHVFGWRLGYPRLPFPSNPVLDEIQIVARPLGGTLPPELFSELELSAVRIAYTNLWGQIPSTLFDSSNLLRLDLSGNAFTGVTLEPFTRLTNLTQLNLNCTPMIGGIPDSIGNLVKLDRLYLGNRAINESIATGPACSNTVGQRTRLGGAIPSTIGNLTDLAILNITDQNLTGTIPTSIGNLKNLFDVDLSSNRLTGSIPTEIGDIATQRFGLLWDSNLQKLDLSDNQLSGSIPSTLSRHRELEHLDLSNNSLTGDIPSSLGLIRNVTQLDLSGNPGLTGCVPPGILNPRVSRTSSTINIGSLTWCTSS